MKVELIGKIRCLFGLHSWKYVSKNNSYYRICRRCGKKQIQRIVEIGQDEYSYTIVEWCDVNE